MEEETSPEITTGGEASTNLRKTEPNFTHLEPFTPLKIRVDSAEVVRFIEPQTAPAKPSSE